jgi:hypothetical protein
VDLPGIEGRARAANELVRKRVMLELRWTCDRTQVDPIQMARVLADLSANATSLRSGVAPGVAGTGMLAHLDKARRRTMSDRFAGV